MKQYGVCLTVCLSQHGLTAANPLLRRARDSSRVRQANAGSATLSAYVGSWTESCCSNRWHLMLRIAMRPKNSNSNRRRRRQPDRQRDKTLRRNEDKHRSIKAGRGRQTIYSQWLGPAQPASSRADIACCRPNCSQVTQSLPRRRLQDRRRLRRRP